MPAGTIKKPFVYDETTGKMRLLAAGETLDSQADVLTQVVAAAGAVAAGAPVSTTESGEVDETDATSASDACKYVGLSCETGVAAANVSVVTQGPLTLATASWDALTGQVGGLTVGAEYWVNHFTICLHLVNSFSSISSIPNIHIRTSLHKLHRE